MVTEPAGARVVREKRRRDDGHDAVPRNLAARRRHHQAAHRARRLSAEAGRRAARPRCRPAFALRQALVAARATEDKDNEAKSAKSPGTRPAAPARPLHLPRSDARTPQSPGTGSPRPLLSRAAARGSWRADANCRLLERPRVVARSSPCSAPGHAAADDGDELKARTHFAAGEYKQALDIYARLYAETMHPTYLRNIARCHQNLGNADKAISSFREYLRKARDYARSAGGDRGLHRGDGADEADEGNPTAIGPPPPPAPVQTVPPPAACPRSRPRRWSARRR